MNPDVHQLVKKEFEKDILSALATYLGENSDQVGLAIDSSITALFAALLKKGYSSGQTGLPNMISTSESILGGHDQIAEKLKKVFISQQDPNGLHSMEQSAGLLENIFGDRLHPVAVAISDFSGVKGSSAHKLLAGATVASMAVIGQYKERQKLDDQALIDWLAHQKKEILAAVPSGLDLAEALGVTHLSEIDTQPNVPDHDLVKADKIAPGKSGKWLLLLIILALLVSAWWFWRNYEQQQDDYKLQTLPAETESSGMVVPHGPNKTGGYNA